MRRRKLKKQQKRFLEFILINCKLEAIERIQIRNALLEGDYSIDGDRKSTFNRYRNEFEDVYIFWCANGRWDIKDKLTIKKKYGL